MSKATRCVHLVLVLVIWGCGDEETVTGGGGGMPLEGNLTGIGLEDEEYDGTRDGSPVALSLSQAGGEMAGTITIFEDSLVSHEFTGSVAGDGFSTAPLDDLYDGTRLRAEMVGEDLELVLQNSEWTVSVTMQKNRPDDVAGTWKGKPKRLRYPTAVYTATSAWTQLPDIALELVQDDTAITGSVNYFLQDELMAHGFLDDDYSRGLERYEDVRFPIAGTIKQSIVEFVVTDMVIYISEDDSVSSPPAVDKGIFVQEHNALMGILQPEGGLTLEDLLSVPEWTVIKQAP